MSTFDDAVDALVETVATSNRDVFQGPELDLVLQGLGRLIRSRYSLLSRDDEVDAVNEALLRFVAAVRDGRIDRSLKPGGYLTTIAVHAAADVLRVRHGEELVDPKQLEQTVELDERLEAVFGQLDDRETVRALMQCARETGQHELTDLIRCWRDLATGGQQPTLRELGNRLGISHTEVRRRLNRLADLGGTGLG